LQVIESTFGADCAEKSSTSSLDWEPSLPEPLDCLMHQILETHDNWKEHQIVENDVNCQEPVPGAFQGSQHLTLKLC
jgi:hypothetical protein